MSAIKGLTRDWGRFPKDVAADLRDKDWPKGTTLEYKNQYRARVVLLMLLASAGLGITTGWPLFVPLAVAVWKVKIILTDK